MRKYVLLLLLVSVAFFTFRYFTAEKPILRIGVECDYAPNNWEENKASSTNLPLVNHQGFYAEGYDVQMARAVADSLGYRLEARKLAWDDLIPALNRNEIDAIFSGMLDSDERKKSIAFSNTYEVSKTEYSILVNSDSDYILAEALEDFQGAKFVGQKETNFDTFIDKIPGVVHLPPVDTVTDMLEALTSNKVDAVIVNLDTGHSYARAFDNLTVIEFSKGKGFNLDYSGICAGVRQSDTELLEHINKALNGISTRERKRMMDKTIARMWKNL